ncbi:Molybdate metabolism regulator [Actinokineospora spheciospongiae]|uniref:Molybdate metabolism regulator n=1 Tax=Actinokineospora spheciospongiae TaxID=909613 RepID=W7IVJ2_9PSEU|nr:DUF4132 domain-containing protein [Actinokineospora spheciospongiae]EWC60436.1 Molybdate metabolism regulator [Actinokineospora spheciospongiae]
MRRLEYVGGGSEKFWEGSAAGTVVTVRWGRIGTNGQTKDKGFATAEAADAHLAKLVAEKQRKGYVEAGASTPAGSGTADSGTTGSGTAGSGTAEAGAAGTGSPAEATAPRAGEPTVHAAPVQGGQSDQDATPTGAPGGGDGAPAEDEPWPDEDTFTPTASVLRHAVPRRGTARPPRKLTPKATDTAQDILAKRLEPLHALLNHPQTDAVLHDAGHAQLTGKPSPLGAAVVYVAARFESRYTDQSKYAVFADHWLAEWGPVFAAEAVLQLTAIRFESVGARVNSRSTGRVTSHDTSLRHAPGSLSWNWPGEELTERVRHALATATDADYAAAVEVLARWRDTSARQAVVAYLLPTEADWVAEALATPPGRHDGAPLRLLASAVGTVEQFERLRPHLSPWSLDRSPRTLPTLVDTLGPALVPALDEWITTAGADLSRTMLGHLAAFPTEEAFAVLVRRAGDKLVPPFLQEAMRRFPRRATRQLAEAVAATREPGVLGTLLNAHVLTRLAVVDAVEVSEKARAVLDGIAAATAARVPEAAPADLPPVLADPPWLRPRTRATPVVVTGLTPLGEPGIAWADGEQEQWSDRTGLSSPFWPPIDWDREFEDQKTRDDDWKTLPLIVEGPFDRSEALLRAWEPKAYWRLEFWGRSLAARFGLTALPALLEVGATQPAAVVDLLQPFTGPEVSALMADWASRLKSVRPRALAYFARHGVDSVRPLVPAALAKAGRERTAAETVIRQITRQAGAEAVLAVAAEYGAEAERGIAALLATDPLTVLPAKLPAVGEWAHPGLLPQVLLADRATALPLSAARDLITIFALGKPGEPYAGLAPVREAVEPGSLARFAWKLFQHWLAAGGSSKDGWVLTALGAVGDDETVRGLAPLIRAWPGEGGHQRAVAGLDVLAEIGTDVALMHLNGIANKVKFKGLKTRAEEKMMAVADALGLATEQLADRLVPDLGLDADGSMVLDYGPRRFTVGFDEQLKPFVADPDGTRRKVLPKPGAKDDPDLAPHAYQLFSGLKKDVKTVAADQVRRLERAMVTGRRWSAAEFTEFFAGHPLLWHLVRRLVWGRYEGGELVGSFRLAEDRTLADVEDNALTLPEGATVGVAHPLHLGAALEPWGELFADYEILQPFPQLGRQVFELTAEDRAGTSLARFTGIEVPTGRVLGLVHRGWERGTPQDGGVEPWITRPLPDGRVLVATLDPGIAVGAVDIFPEQKLTEVWLTDDSGYYWSNHQKRHAFADVDPVAASELLADLTMLTAR